MAYTHLYGILLLIAVAVLWVASSELIQIVFREDSFSKPVLYSYLSQSLFVLLFLIPPCKFGAGQLQNATETVVERDFVFRKSVEPGTRDFETASQNLGNQLSLRQGLAERLRSCIGETLQSSWKIAPFWFMSNCLYNLSLTYTSVASSSIISSLSCVFVLIFGSLLKVERFGRLHILAVVLNVGGLCLVSASDASSAGTRTALGDALAFLGAILYAFQTVLIKRQFALQHELKVSRFLGSLGGICLAFGWPIVLICHFCRVESIDFPPRRTLWLMLTNALVGGVLSNYLWALAICYASALAASLALSLTIPFSVLADAILRRTKYGSMYLLGASLVLVGFLMANLRKRDSQDRQDGITSME
jgi:solute carrier family 35 protein F5